jgi:hypothetical protein
MTSQVTQSEAHQIGIEAYQYFYSLISMDVTRRITTNCPPDTKPGMGPMNAFHHMRSFPAADFRDVVRPNFDTLYSSAWLDLSQEPMIVSAPDTQDRYYLLPMLDLWSDVFAVPGKRTTGTQAARFAVVPRCWQGQLPDGVERIESPTAYVWIIGRTQTNGPADYEAVHQVQNGFQITPLSKWGQTWQPQTVIDPTVDVKTPPLHQVNSMTAAQYFSYGAELMRLNPPHLSDWSIIARLKRIGLVPGQKFDWDAASPDVKAGLEQAVVDGLKLIVAKIPTLARVFNGWQMNVDTMGVYGNYYLKRAIVAMVGLGANQPEDAVYPLNVTDADGQPVKGSYNYVMHFSPAEIPPVDAFWSLTMYDAEGFQVANPLNRFAIGDRDPLVYNADGSLDLYIQHESPGSDKEANWLPTPAQGKLGLTLRLYAPKAEVLDGRWVPPAAKLV